MRSIAVSTNLGSGLRCSSTGVPTITTTCSTPDTDSGSVLRVSRPSASDPLEDLLGALLEERHLAGPHAIDGRRIDVVEHDRQACVGEHEPEREPDATTATDDRDALSG